MAGGGPLIQGNTISYTTTEYDPRQDFGCDYLDGSGIALEGVASGATVISGNIIEHNIGRCGGGGIRVDYAGAPLIANNTIRYNEAKGQGGGIYMVEGNQLFHHPEPDLWQHGRSRSRAFCRKRPLPHDRSTSLEYVLRSPSFGAGIIGSLTRLQAKP